MGNTITTYIAPSGEINVTIQDKTAWLTQKQLAELFGVEIPAINKHLTNIFESGELDEKATISILEIVQIEGNREIKRMVAHYNLKAIIAVGYRMNSKQATEFRKWANDILERYITDGAVINENLVNDKDKFNATVDRLNDMRVSESNLYREITNIAKEICVDYNPNSEKVKNFFATMQNKLHYAITSKTAAEIIYTRANANKPDVGMTTRLHKDKSITQKDVTTAKNYYEIIESNNLKSLVIMFLESLKIKFFKGKPVYFQDFINKLDELILSNDFQLLIDEYRISKEQADKFAISEFKKYKNQLEA
jgi:hypothetical protein